MDLPSSTSSSIPEDTNYAVIGSLLGDDSINPLRHLRLEHALKAVQNNISRSQELTRCWKSIHNSLVPIGRLPSELLLHIFERVQNDSSGLNNDVLTYMHQMPFLRIAQTCHSWRSLVCNRPSMWSKIVFSSERQVKEMLKMAQGSMLSITMSQQYSFSFRPWKRADSGLLDELLDMTRMRALEVQLRKSDLAKILNHLSGEHARGLSLLYIHEDTDLWSARRGDPLIIPPRVLVTPMPNLQYLDLSDCTVPWHSWDVDMCSEWTQLKELKLCRVSRPPARTFYGLLSRMKNLRHLLLDTTLPSSSGGIPSFGSAANDSSSHQPLAQLLRLSSLVVDQSTVADMLVFQAHVSYPKAHAQLHLHLDIDHQSMEQLSMINPLLQSCCMTKNSPTPRAHSTLLLSGGSDGSALKLALFDGQYLARHHISSDNSDSVISEEFFSSVHYQDSPLFITLDFGTIQILPMLSNFPSMTAIEIHGVIDDNTQDQWISFFSSQDEVKHLYVGSPTARKVLTALSANTVIFTTSTEEDDRATQLLLPCLTSLTLDG